VSDRYAAVEPIAHDTRLPTATICEVLELSRSAYADWLTREPGPRTQSLDELTPLIVEIFLRHRRRYGARRIASELADLGFVCSAKRVAKVLRNQCLRAIQPKSFLTKTTDSRHALRFSPNLVQDADEPTRVDELRVGDITSVRLPKETAYLVIVLDVFTHMIRGGNSAAPPSTTRTRPDSAIGRARAREKSSNSQKIPYQTADCR
jgi:transposase InsO family protein